MDNLPGAASSSATKSQRKRLRRLAKEERWRVRKLLVSKAKAQKTKDALMQGIMSADDTDLPEPDVGETILDSGAARHLLSEQFVKDFPEFIKSTTQVMHLITANGPKSCDQVFEYKHSDSGERVVALILPNTPTVFAMGLAVIELGWHFEWPARSYSPFAIKPDGTIVWLVVKDYVVYFTKSQDSFNAHMNMMPQVAAEKRRMTSKRTPQGEEDVIPLDENGVPIPPPPHAPEGASEAAQERSRRRRNLYEEAHTVQQLKVVAAPRFLSMFPLDGSVNKVLLVGHSQVCRKCTRVGGR